MSHAADEEDELAAWDALASLRFCSACTAPLLDGAGVIRCRACGARFIGPGRVARSRIELGETPIGVGVRILLVEDDV